MGAAGAGPGPRVRDISFSGVGTGKEKIRGAMESPHTLKYKNNCVNDLSSGQNQRVWIAMALAQDTDILFLDEPTTYLDNRHQIQILKLVQQLNRKLWYHDCDGVARHPRRSISATSCSRSAPGAHLKR